ncbi:MAG: hypothetical protein J6W04_00280 [Bacteroidales bacterium]|nr:hypothetical protein [Bacteroidales bacterium]
MSNKKTQELREKSARQTDAMTQRRYRNEEQAAGAIRINGGTRQNNAVADALNRSATNADERRARRTAIDSLSRTQIEGAAGTLNANQFTLLNRQQQQWYTDATNARNANRQANSGSQQSNAPKRRTLNQLYAQAYRSGGTPDAVNRRFQRLAKENGYNNVVMTPNGPRELTRATRRNS